LLTVNRYRELGVVASSYVVLTVVVDSKTLTGKIDLEASYVVLTVVIVGVEASY
jgi:hypothetical protein